MKDEYEIKVLGVLDAAWSDLFAEMTLTVEAGDPACDVRSPITTLTGPVADQAALRGMLNKLWDLNLTLISVNCIEKVGGA